jgi:hypothetical protein
MATRPRPGTPTNPDHRTDRVMTKFTPPIRRVDTAKGHKYLDSEGRKVPGVTSILGDGVPKPALITWAANATAEYAVDNWDRLSDLSPSVRMKELQGARYAVKDAAANKGTEVHKIAERLVAGEEVDVPDELVGHAESYARFLDEFQVEPVHVEFSVASYKWGYAGTGDLIGYITHLGVRRLMLMDTKTNRSGIFGETALQLAGYRHADVLISGDEEQPMPEVEGCAGIHVRADGYNLVPIIAEDLQFKQFLYAMKVAEAVKQFQDLVGAPVQPSNAISPYRLVRAEQT